MPSRTLAALLVVFAAASAWPNYYRPAVTAPDGELCISGQVILQLSQSQRSRVSVSSQDGIALFGIPALDELSRRLRVDDITKLMRYPNPSTTARALGCDLQYVVQFDESFSVAEAIELYQALPEVEHVCPNALMKMDETPNDPLFVSQWHLAKVQAPAGWTLGKGDTSVLNMVVDDGGDWLHPDLAANVWINHPEDINSNGRFDTLWAPDGDLDGLDQDGNGYTDDVIGFDMVDGEPNPMPVAPDNHGSHCFGNVNAVTNNSVGVAGATWNNRSVNVRCGGGGYVNLGAAMAAIYYGIPLNVWAYSMSFGGSTRYEPMAAACLEAWNSGAVLFGSAGNEGLERMRYPASYDGVECVAASGQGDTKANFSNFGEWVDLTAPGVNIYTTVTRATGNYGAMDGTSMSCPLAAGVATWVKCWYPSGSNQTILDIVHAACDTMPDQLYREGKLGAGRVNMAKAILPFFRCNLRVSAVRFNDASGNGNGRPDPGEAVGVIVTYANTSGWRDATGVSATLACAVSGVEVTKSSATFPDIPAGSTGNCSADSFVITIADWVPPQNVRLLFTASASPEPAYPDEAYVVRVGEPRVLIVDDDGGSDFEKYYKAACDSNGVLYHTYAIQTAGSPSAETLAHYPVVFWFTGNETSNTLTPTDVANLTAFLNSGRNLMLSGQNIAQELAGQSFLSEYLRAELLADSTGKPYLVGLEGDPIAAGDTMVLAGSGGANNGRHMDGIKPIGGALGGAFYKDYSDTTTYALIHYSGSYRLVFFPVPFEAIDHSASRYLQKWTLVSRILQFFGERVPGVEQPIPQPRLNQPYAMNIAPNPFAREATVRFVAPVSGTVTLNTYALDGRLVASSSRTVRFGEDAELRIDGARLVNGVYLVQLVTADGVYAQKAAVLR
ncbi:T9SS type A sorting domain-containing protein [candidate division WOR-3 bacterium]|nr:T9SS type A sorting domain-containing protein [candidate division WOR-3 bacterium]